MKLRVEWGDDVKTFVPVDSPITVGRQAGCGVRLTHRLVSRAHGRFFWAGERWRFEDTSRHGTVAKPEGGEGRLLRGADTELPDVCELWISGDGGVRLRCRVSPRGEVRDAHGAYKRGLEARARGDWDAALEAFGPLARRDPPVVEALGRVAECLEQVGRPTEALPWAVRYSLLRSGEAAPCFLLARLHASVGDLGSARVALARGAALDPDDPEAARLRERLKEVEVGASALWLATADVYGSPVPHVLETPRFRIECDFAVHGRLLPDLAKALEVAAGRAAEWLGWSGARIGVSLVARGVAPDEAPRLGDRSAAASCGPDGIRFYLPPSQARACHDGPYLAVLALHEVVHALLQRAGEGVPWWLHEGLAQFSSQGECAVGTPPPPEAPLGLEGFEQAPAPGCVKQGYAVALFAVEYLSRVLEPEAFRKSIRNVAAGTRWPEAFGVAPRDLAEGAWVEWRRAVPQPDTFLKTWDHAASRAS